MRTVSEIQIVPVKPNNGLVAFCSFVLFESIYCSSVAIYGKRDGNYRLVYPTKKLGEKNINLFHPINSDIGNQITEEVTKKLNELFDDRYDGYHA